MINQDQVDKLTQGLNELLLKTEEPFEVCQLMSGLLANFVGPIPSNLWDEIMVESRQPCGEPGCTCQIVKQDIFESLDNLRSDWQQYQIK